MIESIMAKEPSVNKVPRAIFLARETRSFGRVHRGIYMTMASVMITRVQ
jgi:hypothetical protein